MKGVRIRLGLAVALLAVASGCRAQRHLVFVSAPPGADVYLDGDWAGRTPLEVPFEAYGARHVTLQRPGYRDHVEVLEVEAPWVPALDGVEAYERLEVLYWLDRSRRDLVLQSPGDDGTTRGPFSLRSPLRPNPIGTAPGFMLPVEGCLFFCMPGVPRELERMIDEQVLPRVARLQQDAGAGSGGSAVRARLLRLARDA